MPPINPNSPAPNFTLRDAYGEKHALSDFHGRAVVLYFYPEDDTPLCTAQACQFRDHHPDFSKIGCAIIGISPDDQASHADFAEKHRLPFTLLADEKDAKGNPKVSTLYGAWGEKNMYGKIVRGMLRTTYLIAPDGTVAKRWDRVKTPGHAAAVLAAVKEIHTGEKLTILGKPKVLKSTPAKKRTNAQTKSSGRAAYSGVRATKGKSTPARSAGVKQRASATRSRGKPR
jgi:peroxiredoxin Q/BCP